MSRAQAMRRINQRIRKLHASRFNRCNRPDLRVACILDEFSYECFKYECKLYQVGYKTWRDDLRRIKPHFLLVESAWRGKSGKWEGKLKRATPEHEISKLVRYCKRKRIKTVFWNKEDPPHYNAFKATANLFDYVFTTDSRCIPQYRKDLGHSRVYALPFAAQPVLHNPVNSCLYPKENVAFAGRWTEQYKERIRDMPIILNPALKYGLHIYDRTADSFKGTMFSKYVIGTLKYADLTQAYKLYKVFLNVNSVRNSPTMFSRRVFEILATGTPIISTNADGIKRQFGSIVSIVKTKKESRKQLEHLILNNEYRYRLGLLGVREINSHHLYQHRFNTILKKIGLAVKSPDRGVTYISFITNLSQVSQVIANYQRQAWKSKELLLLVENPEDAIADQTAASYSKMNIKLLPAEQGDSCAATLQQAIRESKHAYVAYLNPMDQYAPHYTTDLMHAFQYTDAQMVGKHSHYVYDSFRNQHYHLFAKEEHRYVSSLPLCASIIQKSLLERMQWNDATNDLNEAIIPQSKELKLYAADRYNYIHHVPSLTNSQINLSTRLRRQPKNL